MEKDYRSNVIQISDYLNKKNDKNYSEAPKQKDVSSKALSKEEIERKKIIERLVKHAEKLGW